jgi:hypothetical protein
MYTRLNLLEEHYQNVAKEEKRFIKQGSRFAKEYLSAFGWVGIVLAELRYTENSAKYLAAKKVVNDIGKQLEFKF